MKVLMAAPFNSKGRYRGGIMYVANSICEELEKHKMEDFEIEKFETCRIERSNKSNSKINFENIRNFICIYRDLILEVKRCDADVLYYHSSVKMALLKDIIAIRKAKSKTKVKTVLHIHFAEYNKIMFSNGLLNKIIINMLNEYVDKVVFLSRTTADQFGKQGLNKSKVKVIYNFHTLNYTVNQMKTKISKVREKEKIDMLFMGSIDKRKGILDVLQSFNEINREATLHICGSFCGDEIENEFFTMVKKLGKKVVFHGYITGREKTELLLNADVLLLPSYSEGLPIVIMEAFGAGCSVITTDVGAIPEIFKENCGYIIKPGDIEKLKISMQNVIENREVCIQQMVDNYEYGKEFTIQNFVNDISDVCSAATR